MQESEIDALVVRAFINAHGERPRRRSCWTWMQQTIRFTAIRKADSFTATTGNYCYLPLYIFSGEHLLCARLRRMANIDGADEGHASRS